MKNIKQKIGLALSIGTILSIVLVYLITDRYNLYQNLYNFGTFFLIFIVGAFVPAICYYVFFRLKYRKYNSFNVKRCVYLSMLMMNLVLIVIGIASFDYSSPRETPFLGHYQSSYTAPEEVSDDWKVSNLGNENMDTIMYNQIIDDLVNNKKFKRMHSILIAKNGKLVAEDYFYGYHKEKPHDLRSANKIITSILMGICIDKGYIKTIDQKVIDFFPEHTKNENWKGSYGELTIKDLLTMSTGLDCNDWDKSSIGNENKLYKTEDWIGSFFDLPFIDTPGSKFSYCTFGEIMARTIIVKSTGISLQEFADKHLFNPLGIHNYNWTKVMPTNEKVGIRISLTSRDFAKLGQLFLNKGMWNDKRILTSHWIERSTMSHTKTNNRRFNYPEYGFFWWKIQFEIDGRIITGFQALGNGGQLLFVFPNLDMVVVFTAGNYSHPRMFNAFEIMETNILPNAISKKQ